MLTPRQQHCLDGMGIRVWRERAALVADAAIELAQDQDGDRSRSRPVPDGAIRSTASAGDRARYQPDATAEAPGGRSSPSDMQARSVPDREIRSNADAGLALDSEGDRTRHRPDLGAEAPGKPGSHGDSRARSVPDGGDRAGGVPSIEFESWDGLIEAIHACEACELSQNCTQKVPGVGSREADLMIIGEGPGHEEDIRGEPFVGRSGQLLDRMLAAIGIAREQVYITNIVKCRPPNNRDPRPDEALQCRAFLEAQIRAIEPRAILSVGRVSAHNLLGTQQPVGKLIRQQHTLPGTDIPVKVTYHPAYLLRNPSAKATAWQDLKQLHRMLK